MVTIFFNLCMSAWENDTAHQLIEQHAETSMHRHSFPTCQKVLDKNLEPQGPTRVNYRGGKVRQQGKNRQGSLSSMIATAGE